MSAFEHDIKHGMEINSRRRRGLKYAQRSKACENAAPQRQAALCRKARMREICTSRRGTGSKRRYTRKFTNELCGTRSPRRFTQIDRVPLYVDCGGRYSISRCLAHGDTAFSGAEMNRTRIRVDETVPSISSIIRIFTVRKTRPNHCCC